MISGISTEAKDRLKKGDYPKNYRINVLKYDGTVDFTIGNTDLITESVKFDERLCSGDVLKYGLCEGSSLEFRYFNYPSILGKQLQVFVDAYYDNYVEQVISTDYEDKGRINRWGNITVYEGGEYRLYSPIANAFSSVVVNYSSSSNTFTPSETSPETICDVTVDLSSSSYAQIVVNWPENDYPEVHLQKIIKHTMAVDTPATIPMGFYTVEECSRQAETGIRRVLAFNKLQSKYLDKKANDNIVWSFSNPDHPVTFYDIRNVCLHMFEVERDDIEKVLVNRTHNAAGAIRKLSGGAVSLKAKYGIDSPFNYYNFRSTNTTASLSGYLFVVAQETQCELSPTDAYTIRSDYNLELLERHYYYTIYHLLDESCNVEDDFMKRFLNPQSQRSAGNYDSYLGWHNYFGVCLEKSNGTKEWYSTIAYQNHLTNVVGSFQDLLNTTITDCRKIYFYIPQTLLLNGNSSDTSNDLCLYEFYTPPSDPLGHPYEYYIDSTFTISSTKYYSFKDTNDEVVGVRDWDWWAHLYRYTNMSPADLVQVIPSQLPDITLREAVSASYELSCLFGKLDRETNFFSGVGLSQDPAVETINKDMYSKLWADENNVHSWKNLFIKYKGLDANNRETELQYDFVINVLGTDNYECYDNWLLKNLVWTSEQIRAFGEAMVAKMQNVSWFPFEMWGAGLPYIETGDKVEINFNNQTYNSYILQRQLNGIQNLQDTYINGALDIF